MDTKNVKIHFVGGIFPDVQRREIEAASLGGVDYAADTLQRALIRGLKTHYPQLKVVNLPYIGSFPQRYKKLFYKGAPPTDFLVDISFNNLTGLKIFSRYSRLFRYLTVNLDNSDLNVFLVYACHIPFLKAVTDYKKRNSNAIVCLIVPDLPGFFEKRNNIFARAARQLEKLLFLRGIQLVDSLVLLSQHMRKPLDVMDKPWVLVEGVYLNSFDKEIVRQSNLKTVLYTGTLKRKYGVLDLLAAFRLIKNVDYRLHICGDGEAKSDIIAAAKEDSRVSYLGRLPREEVIKLQANATVLVNPRKSDGRYTKYSFPSKTIEYLASGTPVVLHRLAGIPEEYFQFCFVPKSETVADLSRMIVKVCEMEDEERTIIGKKARKFILEQKSPKTQCEKIARMLDIQIKDHVRT